MYQLVEVTTKKQIRDFIQFPLKLYKGNPYFVPPLYADEKKLFSKKDYHLKTNDTCFYLVYDGKNVVGRIQAILSYPSNERRKQKRVRFTRFDSIDNQEVAHLLFEAVKDFALKKGMNELCGPLGYSDLDREGLLIEGFDELSTFEEQYNYPYYQKLIENEGFVKEVDWVERKIFAPKEIDSKIEKVTDIMMKRSKLHVVRGLSSKQIIKRYSAGFFDLIDKEYKDLYMTVAFSKEEREELIKTFNLILSARWLRIIVDENDKVVGVGLCFPSIGKALQKSGGRLTPLTMIKLLHSIRRPKILDLGLIAIDKGHQGSGVAWAILLELMKMLKNGEIEHCETNLNLEDNNGIINNWQRFDTVLHKRRRAFMKKISE